MRRRDGLTWIEGERRRGKEQSDKRNMEKKVDLVGNVDRKEGV